MNATTQNNHIVISEPEVQAEPAIHEKATKYANMQTALYGSALSRELREIMWADWYNLKYAKLFTEEKYTVWISGVLDAVAV